MNFQIRYLLLAVAFVLASFSAVLAQSAKPIKVDNSPSTFTRSHPFESGEELIYVAEFSRLLLKKIDIADFRFSAARQESPQGSGGSGSPTSTASDDTLKLTGDISSKGFFSKLFNLTFRERVESIVDPTFFTVQKSKRIDEQGKRVRVSETTYARGKLFWIERDPNNATRVPRTATASFTGAIQDVLSAVYYLRTQPLEIGKKLEVTISDSGRVFQVPVLVVEKKRMKTVLGRVEAVRVDPQVFGANGMLGAKGQVSIWFTNDTRRIPVNAKIKTEYGTFDITLRKVITPSAKNSPAKMKS
ncbi:MAG TPA: DUF3108 domain-containing protein [Pyrinomonadaceae bacterium]|nr:DUF3108 domain-containing protein [Pyrinomonadaceae bacterium]